jgi:histidyl-tRNA synthetase
MLVNILKKIGLAGLTLELTSIGCKECRPGYRATLKKTLKKNLTLFCEDCQRRFDLNPLRILDCKVPSCIELRKEAPAVLDFLCAECKQHFEALKHHLKLLNTPYSINPNLVRGLDYYTRTAFEVTSESLGSQNAIAAGGRYDRLVEGFGGPPTAGIGFAIGMERIIQLIIPVKKAVREEVMTEYPELFFCTLGQTASEKGFVLSQQLRENGITTEMNYGEASLRSQMRKADRIKAKNVVVIGEDELRKGKTILKDMDKKKETEVILESKDILRVLSGTKNE